MRQFFIGVSLLFFVTVAQAGDRSLWRMEAGTTFSHFQQQVKAQVGDPRGQRLVYEDFIGFSLTGGYRIWEYVHVGLYMQYDRGQRTSALFDGFDIEGKTKVRNFTGGKFSELWFGPLVQFTWKNFTAEAAHAVLGIRSDDGRTDLPAADGDVTTPFRTHPTIAWMFSAGASVPVYERIELLVRVQYRARYYDRRGGKELLENIDHGTQGILPVIGVSWRW